MKIYESLDKLPSELERSYAFEVRELVKNLSDPIKALSQVLEDELFPTQIRFNAFYGIVTTLWEKQEFKKYREFVDKYETIFGRKAFFDTFKCQYYSCLGSKGNLRIALDYAHKAKEKAPDLPNVLHLFTRTVIENSEVLKKPMKEKYFIEAEDAINKAISISQESYARYFATKAELLILMDRFEEASDLIRKAIEIEPATHPSYTLRIGNYQDIRLKITFLDYTKKIKYHYLDSLNKLEEVRLRVIELLGILAAIIAFLVTTIQVGKGLVFEEAARLMIISGGVILIIFSSYSVIFFRETKLSQILVLFFALVIVITFISYPEIKQLLSRLTP